MRYANAILKLLTAMLMLVLVACGGGGTADTPEPNANQQSQVIFPAELAETQQLATLIGESAESYWVPTEADVESMSASVILRLATQEQTAIIDNFHTYQRQFFGFIMNGEPFIYGNFFCDAAGVDSATQFVGVEDGGNCYFQALYKHNSGEIISLTINGDA